MSRSSLRWLFAIVGVASGLYLLVQAAGSRTTIAAGVGLVAVAVGLITP